MRDEVRPSSFAYVGLEHLDYAREEYDRSILTNDTTIQLVFESFFLRT